MLACRSTIAGSLFALAYSGMAQDAEVKVGRLRVPDSVQAGMPYQVAFENVQKSSDDIVIIQACFTWQRSGFTDGPFCFTPLEDASQKTVSANLFTRNPGTYTLYGYVTYPDKAEVRKSNMVRTNLWVR